MLGGKKAGGKFTQSPSEKQRAAAIRCEKCAFCVFTKRQTRHPSFVCTCLCMYAQVESVASWKINERHFLRISNTPHTYIRASFARVCVWLCVFWCFYLFIVLLFRRLPLRVMYACMYVLAKSICGCVCACVYMTVCMGVCLPFVVLVNFILVSFCMFMHASSIDFDWWVAMWGLPVREFSIRSCVFVSRVPVYVRVLVPSGAKQVREWSSVANVR